MANHSLEFEIAVCKQTSSACIFFSTDIKTNSNNNSSKLSVMHHIKHIFAVDGEQSTVAPIAQIASAHSDHARYRM